MFIEFFRIVRRRVLDNRHIPHLTLGRNETFHRRGAFNGCVSVHGCLVEILGVQFHLVVHRSRDFHLDKSGIAVLPCRRVGNRCCVSTVSVCHQRRAAVLVIDAVDDKALDGDILHRIPSGVAGAAGSCRVAWRDGDRKGQRIIRPDIFGLVADGFHRDGRLFAGHRDIRARKWIIIGSVPAVSEHSDIPQCFRTLHQSHNARIVADIFVATIYAVNIVPVAGIVARSTNTGHHVVFVRFHEEYPVVVIVVIPVGREGAGHRLKFQISGFRCADAGIIVDIDHFGILDREGEVGRPWSTGVSIRRKDCGIGNLVKTGRIFPEDLIRQFLREFLSGKLVHLCFCGNFFHRILDAGRRFLCYCFGLCQFLLGAVRLRDAVRCFFLRNAVRLGFFDVDGRLHALRRRFVQQRPGREDRQQTAAQEDHRKAECEQSSCVFLFCHCIFCMFAFHRVSPPFSRDLLDAAAPVKQKRPHGSVPGIHAAEHVLFRSYPVQLHFTLPGCNVCQNRVLVEIFNSSQKNKNCRTSFLIQQSNKFLLFIFTGLCLPLPTLL